MDIREVDQYFHYVFENIDSIMNSDFYKNKGQLKKVRDIFTKWYEGFKEGDTLKGISVEELEYIDLEITDIFDMYISSEPVKENYVERLIFNLDRLKHSWKDEMLGG